MTTHHDRWSQIRERTLADSAARTQYGHTLASVLTIRRLLQSLDAARESAGLSKSELARKIGASPASIRRLFTSPAANPSLRTILNLASALDMDVTVKQRPVRRRAAGSGVPRMRGQSVAAR